MVAILPVHDLFVRRLNLQSTILRSLPLAVIGLLYFGLRASIVSASPFSFFEDMTSIQKSGALLQIIWLYASLLLLPFPLSPFYDRGTLALKDTLLSFEVGAGALVLVLLVALGLRWRKEGRAAFLSVALILSLLPYSHIIPFTVGAAERFLYLPGAFACLLVGLGADSYFKRGSNSPFLSNLAIVFVGCWVLGATYWSSVRHSHWYSNRSILSHTTEFFPESFNAWKGLGDICREEGSLEDAVDAYARAQEVAPYPIAAYLEASTLLDMGRVREARYRLDDFVQRHPDLNSIDPKGMKMLSDLVQDLNARINR